MKILSSWSLLVVVTICGSAQEKQSPNNSKASASPRLSEMDKVYSDESHCLTASDMRGERDAGISCYCRDAIMEARYVYSTYILGDKDLNLKGVFLRLERNASDQCRADALFGTIERQDWHWPGPEVVRTYPPDDVIKRIKPEPMRKGATTLGRWVPFTVQLVYRDKDGHVVKTENYSSREFLPDFSKADKATGNK